jgi:hypothetical protein
MSDINRTRTVFIRDHIALPKTLLIESDAFLRGWRIVTNLDRQALITKVESAHWNFFYLAGELRATVLGRDRLSTLRRAVKRVLAKHEGEKFNCLEVTKIVLKRFLGIPFMSVAAHFRHIQEGIGLVPAKNFILDTLSAGIHDVGTRQYTALISNS